MRSLLIAGVLSCGMLSYAALPEQAGTYIGVAKLASYDHETGKKTTSALNVELKIEEDNMVALKFDETQLNSTATNVGRKLMSYRLNFGSGSMTAVGKFSGKFRGINGSLTLIAPNLYQTGKFKLKKLQ